jgi:hypothetical protein
LNPPYAIRFTSNGISSVIIAAISGSFSTRLLTALRWAFDR